MNFINSDKIQWEEGAATKTSPESILGEVGYRNPPKHFTLLGVRYRFLGTSMERMRGERDGEMWYMAQRVDEGEQGMTLWVSESREGEFIQVLVPRSMWEAEFIVK